MDKAIPYYADITDMVLKNAHHPYSVGNVTVDTSRELFDWIITPTKLSANGNWDNTPIGGVILMYTNYGPSGTGGITNGKFYQTVELGVGVYTLNTFVYQTTNVGSRVFLVANLGDSLPDTDDVEKDSYGYINIGNGIAAGGNEKYSINFTISEKREVSLGFALDLPPSGLSIFATREVQLLRKY